MMDEPFLLTQHQSNSTNSAASPEPTPHHNQQHDGTESRESFSPFVASCFTLNYIMGTGFLTLPWAFVQSGVALSAIIMLTIYYFSDVTKDFVLEGMARAEELKRVERLVATTEQQQKQQDLELVNIDEEDDRSWVETGTAAIGGSSYDDDASSRQLLMVKSKKFEINELLSLFSSRTVSQLYNVMISMYFFLAMWAYASVFSNALVGEIPLFDNSLGDYNVFTLIFALIVVPLSCMELREQVGLQVFLSVCRVVMAILMVVTLLAGDNGNISGGSLSEAGFDGAVGSSLWDAGGLAQTLPIITFSFVFHHSIPGLSQPVAKKEHLGVIFRSALLVCFFAYSFIAVTVGWYFGCHVEKSANMNWKVYRGGTGTFDEENEVWVGVAWWARAISGFIVCFPALDVISVYPLNAITLGNNLLAAWYDANHTTPTNTNERKARIIFRLLASIPPIIGAFIVHDLGVITDYAGVVGYTIMFSFPAVIYIYSKKLLRAKGLRYKTCYSTIFGTKKVMGYTLLILGLGMMALDFMSLLFQRK